MESIKKYSWVFKGILAVLVVVGVSLLYLPVAALSMQIHTPITLATPVDLMIPLIPVTIIVYWYIFYSFIFFGYLYFAFIQIEYRNTVVIATVLISMVAYAIYLIIPVLGPERLVTGTDFFSEQIRLLYTTDTHVNCFPSLHGSYSLLTAYSLWKAKREYGYIAWPTAIAVQISTLFVRQHWLVDQFAAAIITLTIAYLVFDRLKYTRVERSSTDVRSWQIIIAIILAVVFMVLYIYSFTLV